MTGATVSHYRILEKLGEGGMGVVYRAEDLRLGRQVAIKFLASALSEDPEAKQRFVQEARAASALDHAAIGVVHEIDESPEHGLFIVMGCYDGGSLADRLRAGPLPPARAAAVAARIAAGLARAHAAGIVHRDLKPGNVMMAGEEPRLVDFGIAKLAGVTATAEGTAGTIGYMAPEQLRGEPVDARADLFALGVVLHEMLTGVRPFAGEHPAAVMYAVVHETPPRLDAAGVAGAPPGLQEVVDRLLAKDPDRRYQEARDAAADLEALARGEVPAAGGTTADGSATATAGAAAPAGPTGRLPARLARARPLAWAALAVALAAAAGWFLAGRGGAPAEAAEPALAVIEFRDLTAPDDPAAGLGLTSLLQVGLVESSPVRVLSSEYLHDLRRRRFGEARGPIAADQALEVARRAGATVLLTGQLGGEGPDRWLAWRLVETADGRSLAAQRLDTAALTTAAAADSIVAQVVRAVSEGGRPGPTTPVASLTTTSPLAYRYFVAAILARDASRFREAAEELQAAIHADSTFALAHLELSRLYYTGTSLGMIYDLARQHAEAAWNLREHLGVRDRLRLEAWRQQLTYRVGEAIATYQQLLERWPDDREILVNYHRILFHYWYGDRALAVAEQGLRHYPEDLYFGLFYQIGLAHQGRLQEALTATRRYLAQHRGEPNTWDELGLRFLSLGRPDSAEVAFGRALRLDDAFLPSRRGLTWCDYVRGDLERAVAGTEAILADTTLARGVRVEVLIDCAFWPGLSLMLAEAGRGREALAVFEQARTLVEDPTSELRLDMERCRILLRLGRAPEVLAWARHLRGHPASRLAPLAAVRYEARALAAMDSLEAARDAVARLYTTEDSWGGLARFEALKVTAEIDLAQGDPDKALECLAEMARHGISDGGLVDLEYREALARAHLLADRPLEAARVLEGLLAVYGGHGRARLQLGGIYERIGRPDDARRQYEACLRIWRRADPDFEPARAARAALEALGPA